MITSSVFHSLWKYFREIYSSVVSHRNALSATLPYLFPYFSNDLTKEVTEQYPDPVSSRTPSELPSRFRGLVNNQISKCTGCQECEKICPSKCIHVEVEPADESGRLWVSIFDIDDARCIFCGLCVEVCEPASLSHTREFERAGDTLQQLKRSFGKGKKR